MLDGLLAIWDILSALWWVPAFFTVFLILTGKMTIRHLALGRSSGPRSEKKENGKAP